MAELQKAQSRRKNTRRAMVAGVIVVIAIVLALVTGGVFSGGSKTTTATGSTTTTPGATTPGATTPGATTATTAPAPTTSVAPLPPAKLDANLVAHPAPPISPDCNVAPSAPITAGNAPAKPPAVAVIHAPKTVPFPKLDGSSPHYTAFSQAPPFCIDVNKTYTATMTTDVGVIKIELLPKYAPVTVNNFVFLAGYHFFDGTVFHRVIQGFVNQGGDPTGTGAGGPGYKFKDELPKSSAAYDDGSVAMANSGANTNGSQFFLVVGNGGEGLNPANYSMFGQITGGFNVAQKINAAGASASDPSQTGTPTVLHKITSVTITES